MPLSYSKSSEITGSSQRSGCHVYFIVSLQSTHLYPRILNRNSCLRGITFKSLPFQSLTLICPLNIQQKARGHCCTWHKLKWYCHSVSFMIYIQIGGYITHRAQRNGCKNEHFFKEVVTLILK